MIGHNNLGIPRDNSSFVSNSRQAARGVQAVVDKAREYCPSSKIVLTYILPARNDYGMTRAKIEMTNRLLVNMLKNYPNLYCVDIEEGLTLENGLPNTEMFIAAEASSSLTHLDGDGYDVWGAALVPFITSTP